MPSTALREIALLKEGQAAVSCFRTSAEPGQELKDHANIVKLINIFYKPNKCLGIAVRLMAAIVNVKKRRPNIPKELIQLVFWSVRGLS